MGDSTEEFEPLFDYRRIQPVNVIPLEDDSDSPPPFFPKRRKVSKATDNKKVEDDNEDGKTAKVVDCVDLDDEEDWLPPPPKNAAPNSKREEDSALKQLRLKKQELASLVQSAQDALRAAEEAGKKVVTGTSISAIEQTTEEPPKPAAERAKIVISIQDKAEIKQYRIFADDKFEQLFKKYAEKLKIAVENLIFSFDGDKINPASTPVSLGMEDDDLIEVNVKAS